MAAFPIFAHLHVTDYGLYPGAKKSAGLDISLDPGLTLVLGANGLGKTTLVMVLFRLCTGPYDIPKLQAGGELGGTRIQAGKLRGPSRRLFAERVNDKAENAEATLSFTLGETHIAISRSLASLDLLKLEIDGEVLEADELTFQELVKEAAGLTQFGDWLLLLRHLTFYFEDRRALVWDPSAQRQLLRMLFLSDRSASKWTSSEREILELDSTYRNLLSVLNRQENELGEIEGSIQTDGDLRGELNALENLQKIDQPKVDTLNDQIAELVRDHENAKLELLKAENEQESTFRDLERRQLLSIAAAFPDADDTARYIYAQLISDDECLACGHRSAAVSARLKERISKHRCVVCSSPIELSENAASITSRAISRAERNLERAGVRLEACRHRCEEAEKILNGVVTETQELNSQMARRSYEIEALAKRLPPNEAELHEHRNQLAVLRAEVEAMKQNLVVRRKAFARLIQKTSREIAAWKEDIQRRFTYFAEGFLLEDCSLAWAPHKDRVGESGSLINFPAFELEMGGADFPSPVRRSGPENVSESQREFIDLAFRMALTDVAGAAKGGSLVIDAPESSLDAVFVSRAADVLSRFAADATNRLLVTSNLVEGNLIPELLRNSGITSPSSKHVVDLLKVAAPTAATKSLKVQYAAVRSRIFREAQKNA
jgi:peptidoglycan hydrolase CwlO-like protein